MKIDLAVVAIAAILTSCAPVHHRDPGTAPKAAHIFGIYERSTQDPAAAIKGSAPDIEFAFEGAAGDSLIWFRSESSKSLFRGAWWAHEGALYQLDSILGGTLSNGRYDDLVIQFWEPRTARGHGIFSGSSDAVRLDCATPERASYRTLSRPGIDNLKTRIRTGGFEIIPLPAPGIGKPHTPCEAAHAEPTWSCARPSIKACGMNEACPNPPQEDSTAKDYALEIKCLIEWLDEFSSGKADPKAYEQERARAQVVLKKLSAWAKTVPAKKKP